MSKLILTETQYKKLKKDLFEDVINQTLVNEQDEDFTQNQKPSPKELGIDVNNGALKTLYTFTAENAQGSTRDELKLFKGAVFKVGPNFSSKGILVANTKIQMVGSLGGGAGAEPRQSQVHYYCKRGKFNIPGLPDSYFIERNDSPEGDMVSNQLKTLCGIASKPQTSSKGTVGQTTYNSKNPNLLKGKKDKTKKITIPPNTAFSFNPSKNGVGFKVNFQNGWYDCKTSTFIVNKVSYESKYLADSLSKNLCKATIKQDQPLKKGGGGDTQTGDVRTGTVNRPSNNVLIADFQNYI